MPTTPPGADDAKLSLKAKLAAGVLAVITLAVIFGFAYLAVKLVGAVFGVIAG